MDDAVKNAVGGALARIPSGLFVLTAEHEDRRMGTLVSWVQQVCFEPPMVSVAVAKGKAIMPLISESRHFGLCQLSETDKIAYRKFSQETPAGEDPFLGFELSAGRTVRVPILASAMSFLECELACHMDVEGDHDLFVGRAKSGGFRGGTPRVHLRTNGFAY